MCRTAIWQVLSACPPRLKFQSRIATLQATVRNFQISDSWPQFYTLQPGFRTIDQMLTDAADRMGGPRLAHLAVDDVAGDEQANRDFFGFRLRAHVLHVDVKRKVNAIIHYG